MKKIFSFVLLVFVLCVNLIYAEWVNGYTRKDGTYVYGYYSSDFNNVVTDQGQYLGNLSTNKYDPDSTSNVYGAGSEYKPNSINNPYGKYGSEYSPSSVNNPYAVDTPKLYDSEGNYRGKLSTNKYDPDSISNPYGRYGSKYSPDSINNPYGAGSKYESDSPNNPYGSGWSIYGDE